MFCDDTYGLTYFFFAFLLHSVNDVDVLGMPWKVAEAKLDVGNAVMKMGTKEIVKLHVCFVRRKIKTSAR